LISESMNSWNSFLTHWQWIATDSRHPIETWQWIATDPRHPIETWQWIATDPRHPIETWQWIRPLFSKSLDFTIGLSFFHSHNYCHQIWTKEMWIGRNWQENKLFSYFPKYSAVEGLTKNFCPEI
jgi:hypothetical protein